MVDVVDGDDAIGVRIDVLRVEESEVRRQLVQRHLVMQPVMRQLEVIGHVVTKNVLE